MKHRSLEALSLVMRSFVGSDGEALALVNGFEDRARGYDWPVGQALPREKAFVFEGGELGDPTIFFLQTKERDSGPETGDEILLVRYASSRGPGKDVSALFMNNVDCHPDWLALKLLTELDVINASARIMNLPAYLDVLMSGPSDTVESRRLYTMGYMRGCFERRAYLIARLIDDKLDGELFTYLNSLGPSGYEWRVDEGDLEDVAGEIFTRIIRGWPEPASEAELNARLELVHAILQPAPPELEGHMH